MSVHFVTVQILRKQRRIVGKASNKKMNVQAVVLAVAASIAVTFCMEVGFKDCGSKILLKFYFTPPPSCLVSASQNLTS